MATTEEREEGFVRARHQLLAAAAGMAVALAIAGSVNKTVGGVVLLLSWASGLWSLHRLGRAGG